MESSLDFSSGAYFPASFHEFVGSRRGRAVILLILACFSLPPSFLILPDIGLDASWQLSLQLASGNGKVFGREYVFTYGPLGWLLVSGGVSKAGQLLYDFFIMGSLLSVYSGLLPARPRPLDAVLMIGLAMVTKLSFRSGPSGVLFTLLCYWLWRSYDRGNIRDVLWSLVCAVILFFGKLNYGFLMLCLIPAYGIGLIILSKARRLSGLILLATFPLLIMLGAAVWHVDLHGYLRSSMELIGGYSEAMFSYSKPYSLSLELAGAFLLTVALLIFFGWRRLKWSYQAMIIPLVGLDCLLLYKNGFVRSDALHNASFFQGLPLLLAFWCVAWRFHKGVKALLCASIFYSMAVLIGHAEVFSRDDLLSCTPLKYLRQASLVPRRLHSRELQSLLQAHYPGAVIPKNIKATIGRSSVDVMPWETSIAVLNGLNLKQRPMIQSYGAYTTWLDSLNGHFLSSSEAPDYILYACAQESAIDGRLSAWDESIAKRSLLENYVLTSEFTMPIKVWDYQGLDPACVFLLKRVPGASRLLPIFTNEVTLTLNQKFPVLSTTNLLFLTLEADRTTLGRIKGVVLSPTTLNASFDYMDGSSNNFRAILPILKTGVLVNRRVESTNEVRNWLEHVPERNMGVSSISFNGPAWAFKHELKGSLIECRIVQNTNTVGLALSR